ncbi:KAP P-loop domain protein [Vibrio mediterranei AK1]|uniref:KAP family P-loop NTPase fold protein n=1 Tax=Vibrio mediterranei TaxID=689 RepID=UPI0001541521|nr:P-loop NTPase fold protein [Vibrio mediterranei]EDL53572.1 KAP P-loop domain protein [Vibrio mediterranei AK1]
MPETQIKHHNWLEEFTFENCRLNRNDYGQFIADYITEENEGFVLNLNGAWGSGKTQFLKRLYTLLNNQSHPTIYIDAWESDFTKEPLTVVSSELLSQLEKYSAVTGSDFDAVKSLLGKFIKGTAIAASGYVSKKLLDDSSTGIEAVKTLFEKTDADYISSIQKGYTEQIDAIKEIRKKLSLLAEVLNQNHGQELPIVVLVDELDRCRPDYAIEMLEVIKHFFDTKHFVFVVATDTDQLCCSIKAIYGDDFDSEKYLKRFFHRKAQLPTPDLKHYLAAGDLQEQINNLQGNLNLIPKLNGIRVDIPFYLEVVADAYGLDIRSVDQLSSKLLACLRTANNSARPQIVNAITLLIALVEFDLSCPSYAKRSQNNTSLSEVTFSSPSHPFILYRNDGQAPINALLDLNLESSLLVLKTIEDHWGERQVMRPMHPDDIARYTRVNEEQRAVLDRVGGEIQTLLRNHLYDPSSNTDSSPQFWLWDDYKRVVELAGNIE